jgi:hypothetical protein
LAAAALEHITFAGDQLAVLVVDPQWVRLGPVAEWPDEPDPLGGELTVTQRRSESKRTVNVPSASMPTPLRVLAVSNSTSPRLGGAGRSPIVPSSTAIE